MARRKEETTRYRSPDEQFRDCLGCDKRFLSTHFGNRFCGACKTRNAAVGGVDAVTNRKPNRRKEGSE